MSAWAMTRSPKTIWLNAQRSNQCGECSRLLSATWIIQKEPWEGLTPGLQHSNQRAARKMRRSVFFRHVRKTYTVKSSAYGQR